MTVYLDELFLLNAALNYLLLLGSARLGGGVIRHGRLALAAALGGVYAAAALWPPLAFFRALGMKAVALALMLLAAFGPARRTVRLGALFLALAFLLPMVTGHVPQVGNMLCPMHFPILLCGFVLGGPWGLAVGFIAPLVRSVLFGMPPMFPIAISMAFELAAYGLVSGVLWRKVKHTVPMMYASLVTAMVAGRLVWGAVRFVLAGLTGSSFPFSAFLSGALLTAVPGIAAQLVLIPLILVALQKAKFMD